MDERVAIGKRLKEARLYAAIRQGGSVSQERMAELMEAELGRTFHQTQWSRYERGEFEPPLDVIRAVARISGMAECYLAFGQIIIRGLDPSSDYKLSDEEIAEAERVAEHLEAERAEAERRRLALRSKLQEPPTANATPEARAPGKRSPRRPSKEE